jgi:arylsulfatase A-like enzyme
MTEYKKGLDDANTALRLNPKDPNAYDTRGTAAHTQNMSIERTLQEHWDLKIATGDEMRRDTLTPNRLRNAYLRMPPEVQAKWDSVYAPRIAEYRSGRLQGKELVRWKYQQYMRDYLATVVGVDENVGRLLNYLKQKGELDNTIIVYASDQGFFLGEHGWFDKRFMYEESQRMPMLIRYPRLIRKGSSTNALAMNVDFAPTLLDLAGVAVPRDMQGTSLRPVLTRTDGHAPADWRKAVYYHYYEYPGEHDVKRHYGIRTADYKLIHFYHDTDEWEMYDLRNDPHELNNLYGKPAYAERQAALTQLLEESRRQYNDTVQEALPARRQ